MPGIGNSPELSRISPREQEWLGRWEGPSLRGLDSIEYGRGKHTYSMEVIEPMRIRGKRPFHLDDRSATPKNFSDADERLAKIKARQDEEATRVREPYWAWTMIDADRDNLS